VAWNFLTVVFKINNIDAIFRKEVSERLIMILVHKSDGMSLFSSKYNLKFVCERALNGTLLRLSRSTGIHCILDREAELLESVLG
jgi:hypothetical protein